MRKIFVILLLFAMSLTIKAALTADTTSANEKHFLEEDIRYVEVTKPSNLSAEEFDILLEGTSLEGYGYAFKHMEEVTGTNGVFAIAVAMFEGGIERGIVDTRNNYFGLCGSQGKLRYNTVDENIVAFGKTIQKPVYRGKSFLRFAATYCPPNTDMWARVVSAKYERLVYKYNDIVPIDYSDFKLTMRLHACDLI